MFKTYASITKGLTKMRDDLVNYSVAQTAKINDLNKKIVIAETERGLSDHTIEGLNQLLGTKEA